MTQTQAARALDRAVDRARDAYHVALDTAALGARDVVGRYAYNDALVAAREAYCNAVDAREAYYDAIDAYNKAYRARREAARAEVVKV